MTGELHLLSAGLPVTLRSCVRDPALPFTAPKQLNISPVKAWVRQRARKGLAEGGFHGYLMSFGGSGSVSGCVWEGWSRGSLAASFGGLNASIRPEERKSSERLRCSEAAPKVIKRKKIKGEVGFWVVQSFCRWWGWSRPLVVGCYGDFTWCCVLKIINQKKKKLMVC